MTTVEHAGLIAAAGFTVHEFPNGTPIYYRDKPDHSYWRDVNVSGAKVTGSGRLTGISTVVKPLAPDPSGLIRWNVAREREGIAALAAEGLGCDDAWEMREALAWLRDADSIGDALQQAGLRAQDALEEAGTRGTRTHRHAFEALAGGQAVPSFDGFLDEERGYAQAVAGWWFDTQPLPVHSELVVADLGLGLAGRLDLVYLDGAGRTVLADLKTGNTVMAPAAAQVALYARCYRLCEFGVVDRMEIIHARPDGSHRVIPVADCEDAALGAVACYRAANDLGRQLKQAVES